MDWVRVAGALPVDACWCWGYVFVLQNVWKWGEICDLADKYEAQVFVDECQSLRMRIRQKSVEHQDEYIIDSKTPRIYKVQLHLISSNCMERGLPDNSLNLPGVAKPFAA